MTLEVPDDMLEAMASARGAELVGAGRGEEVADLLRYFAYGHLDTMLQEISRPFAELAALMARRIPDCPELVAGLRKLLEAKDCMVRAKLPGTHTFTT